MSLELSFPAITYNGKDLDVAEAFAQANRRFLDIEANIGDSSPGGAIADRSISNVKLMLGTITDAEIADDTITAAKMDITKLSDIKNDLGAITKGTLTSTTYDTDEGFVIDLNAGTLTSGGTMNKYFQVDKYGQLKALAVDLQGKMIALSGETGPFTIGAGKLYSAIVEHYGDGSFYGASPNWVAIDGDDATWRMWIGAASPISANFAVNKTGNTWLTGATIVNSTITGATASGGTYSGITMSGDITAGNIPTGKSLTLEAAASIVFAGDTNLYRSASNVLKSDDAIYGAQLLSGPGGSLIQYGSSESDYVLWALAATNTVYTKDVSTTGKITATGTIQGKDVVATGGMSAATDIYAGPTGRFGNSGGNLHTDQPFGGLSLQTAAPGSSTPRTGAAWKLGEIKYATVSLSTANYVELDVNGSVIKLAMVT